MQPCWLAGWLVGWLYACLYIPGYLVCSFLFPSPFTNHLPLLPKVLRLYSCVEHLRLKPTGTLLRPPLGMLCSYCGQNGKNSQSHQPQLPLIRDTNGIGDHEKLEPWLEDLSRAINLALADSDVYYITKAALLLSWEDSDMPTLKGEMEGLKNVLVDGFGFEVEDWQIPRRDTSDLDTMDKIRHLLNKCKGPDNLVFVYYAGHGRPGNNPSGAPVWYAR